MIYLEAVEIITKTCPCNKQRLFSAVMIENFIGKKKFIILAQNIDCAYMIEPPGHSISNKYPQSMFLSKNKKK